MPRFSWESYQQIIGRTSILVNSLFEKGDIAAILPNKMMSSHDFGKYNESNHIRKCGKIVCENSCQNNREMKNTVETTDEHVFVLYAVFRHK